MGDTIKLSNDFHKLASMWEAPPAMVEKLQKNVLNVYAATVMYIAKERAKQIRKERPIGSEKTYADVEIENLKEVFMVAKKDTNWPATPPQNISGMYNIDLTGWKYMKPEIEKLFKQWIKEGLYDPQIRVDLEFKSNGKERGYYDHGKHKIQLFIFDKYLYVNDVEHFKLFKATILRTVEHEIEHMAQFILGDLLRKKNFIDKKEIGDTAGLPKKKIRNLKHDFYGRDIENFDDETSRLPHPEQDIEFYTDIKNSISYFKFHIGQIINSAKKDLFKAWVGEEPNRFKEISDAAVDAWEGGSESSKTAYRNFINRLNTAQFPFSVLKDKKDLRWKMAVKIFYNAVQHLL
jgi:hypothetical protein